MLHAPRPDRSALRRHAVAAGVLAGLAVTCAGSGAAPAVVTASRGDVPVPSTSVAASGVTLAAADALLFSNRYDAAGDAYSALVTAHPHDPGAGAAYALYLNYRHQQDDALREARRAAAVDPSSGRAQAVLCRVLDWSGRIDDAVAAGGRATELAPDDPLAHLYYSEALADHGDTAGAQREIDRATPLLGRDSTAAAYARAEVWREQANLAHDQGRAVVQISFLQKAYEAQPGWVERVDELAQAYLDDGQLDGARLNFARALALVPDDLAVLQDVGRVALLQADYATARTVYRHALDLAPGSATLLELNGQVAMAADQDVDTAASFMERALQADPTDEEAAAYLLHLDRDLRGDDSLAQRDIADAVARGADDLGPRGVPAPPNPEAVASAAAQRALDDVNTVRAAAGLAPVRLDARLQASADAHVYYWLYNNASPSVAKLGVHRETAGLPGFSGVLVGDRDRHFGYVRWTVGEDITHRGAVDAAVDDWVNSVYHRIPVVRPDLEVIGFAMAAVGPLPIEDMEFGFAPPGAVHAPVVYPGDGGAGVATTFVDNELPDPLPAGADRTAGSPVTVTFDAAAAAALTSFTLAGPDGATLPAYTLAPSGETENSASLLPSAPLRPHTRYTAHIAATVDGRAYSRSWSFTTGG